MTTRFVKGKARTETPRIKDLTVKATARDPSEGRDAQGRFAAGNPHAIGHGYKALIRKGLGNPDDPQVAELVRNATKLYTAILASLPSDGAAVRQLVASQARHVVLATHFANLAAKAGLATDAGLKLAEAARSHDTTAQRLSVTAYDRAVREAQARPRLTGLDRLDAEYAAYEAAQRELPPKSTPEPDGDT
ncbi:MAG: hypothetical protein IPM35_20330 [Myxococcales bacterium]|nr:hypothetical protein [Myxococcales bacterium]